MTNFAQHLKEKLDSMSQEELDALWAKYEKYDIGPTVDEYLETLKEYESNIS